MAGIFNPSIFNNQAFNTGAGGGGPIFNTCVFNTGIFNTGFDNCGAVISVVKTGTGGIDPGEGIRRKRHIIKPTGLVEKKELTSVQSITDQIVEESRVIQSEVAEQLAREFTEETQAVLDFKPIEQMTMAEVHQEIGTLLRKQFREEDEEIMLLMLTAMIE